MPAAEGKSAGAVSVVGAGLAGCEAACVLARAGIPVTLLEMKPAVYSPAHSLAGPAELVCSNSLKSDSLDTAHGLLKAELRDLGSALLAAADGARVPAGSALAVDRRGLSRAMTALLEALPAIDYLEGREIEVPPPGSVILATGPLTSPKLVAWLQAQLGSGDDLYFYDALAPIVDAASLDRDRIFAASRWGKGGDDYLNCPLNEAEYRSFVSALRAADRTPLHDFEETRYFEGCLPVEVLADRGDDVLAFGPMRPVGLEHEGRRPFAVVQLRAENEAGSAYNLVGFQTKLTRKAQAEVFRSIPGLARAEFLRYGAVHRNLFVQAPRVLDERLALKTAPEVQLAGQIVGVEGYVESAAMGWLAGWILACERGGRPFVPPPPDTAIGALYAHVCGRTREGEADDKAYEPMNIHFGLLPAQRGRGRKARRQMAVERARRSFAAWKSEQQI